MRFEWSSENLSLFYFLHSFQKHLHYHAFKAPVSIWKSCFLFWILAKVGIKNYDSEDLWIYIYIIQILGMISNKLR